MLNQPLPAVPRSAAAAGRVLFDATVRALLGGLAAAINAVFDGSRWAFTGGVAIAGGPHIARWLSNTAVLDFPSVPANGAQTLMLSVPGALAGDTVILAPPVALDSNLNFSGYLSGDGVVAVRVHNTSGGAVDPVAATWRATVIGYAE